MMNTVKNIMNTVKNYTTIHSQLNQIDVGSCNTLNNLSNEIYVVNKTED